MFESLNIALLSIHSCPFARLGGKDTGGMNVYIRELCRELSSRGHRLDIFTAAHQCGHCPWLMQESSIKLYHLDSHLEADLSSANFSKYIGSLASEIDTVQETNNYKYDIIHSHYWQSGAAGIRLQAKWQVPHLTMFHTLSAVKALLHIANHDPNFRQEQEYLISRACSRIIAATVGERNNLHSFYHVPAHKVEVVPCGINLHLFKPLESDLCRQRLGMSAEEKILLFVGRLEPSKGIEQLLHAFYLIRNSFRTRLLIVGGDSSDREYLEQLKRLTRQLKIENSVTFQSSVPQPELPLYYSSADICLVPSYHESFCLVILESLACGTPVISTDVGIAGAIINEGVTGLLLQDNSPQTIAGGILQMLGQGAKSNASISTCRSGTYPYTWKDIAQRIETVYISLCESRLAQSTVT